MLESYITNNFNCVLSIVEPIDIFNETDQPKNNYTFINWIEVKHSLYNEDWLKVTSLHDVDYATELLNGTNQNFCKLCFSSKP